MELKSIMLIFLLACTTGIVGAEIGYKLKQVSRTLYHRIAVSLVCGFASGLLTLVISSLMHFSYQILLAIITGLLYGYIMVNAPMFDTNTNT